MSEDTEPIKRTPTATLLNCLEEFGESEPQHLAVVWLSADGFVNVSRDQNTSEVQTLGLLEAAKLIFGKHFTFLEDEAP